VLFLAREKATFPLKLHQDLSVAVDSLTSALKTLHEEDPHHKPSTVDTAHVQPLLHKVFMHLWQSKWIQTTINQFPDPTICYIALTAFKKDGSFHTPQNITSPIAALFYVLRCAFKFEASTLCAEGGDEVLEQVMKTLSLWFTDKQHTPFGSLSSLQHYLSGVSYSTPTMPNTWWVDKVNYQVLRYKGHKIEMSSYRQMLHSMQDKMLNIWEKDVCLGLNLRVEYEELADNFSNSTPGYSFISDPRNPFQQSPSVLLDAIMQTPHLRDKFITVTCTGDYHFNIPVLHAWLRKLEELELLSIAMAMFLTGGPARGTEMEHMKFCNTEHRQRNLFAMASYIGMVRMYTKTNVVTGTDSLIPTAFDALHADLVVQTLAIARPFALIAATFCFAQQPAVVRLYSDQMWMAYGRPIKSEELSMCMKHHTTAAFGAPFGIRDVRQFSTTIRRKLIPMENALMEGDDEVDSLDAMQMGHSRRVDIKHYGLTTDGLIGSEDVLPALLDHSTAWHRVCGVPPGS
jgi:hypothetical protein